MGNGNSYNWDANDYAKNSSAQQRWAVELISKLKLKGNEHLLDLGCGDGKITAEIARLLIHGNVLGVDSSKEMIDLALKKHLKKDLNLSFSQVDARELIFKDRFDIVFSNAALHWIKNHRPLVTGIKNSLKNNGRALLQMGGKGNAQSVFSIFETMKSEDKWISYFTDFEFPYVFYDTETYEKLIKEAGLKPVRVELIPKDMSYKGKADFASWVRTTWLPYTNRIPVPIRSDFVSEIVERYIDKYHFDSNGYVHVDMIRLEVEAIKE